MKEIIVTSQTELDALPIDVDGRIIVKFGTPYNRAIINRRFRFSVVAWGNSSVEARENSSVVAWENSSVVAWENSSVEAWENSSVEAWGNSSVVAWGNSSVVAWENSSVVAWGNSSVEARENSSVEAWGNSSVVAWGNSSVEARENSSVEAWENSSVEAHCNSQVCDCSRTHKISTSANARIVYNPRNIKEYCENYDVPYNENAVKLYKAVRNRNGRYFSDRRSTFEYVVGEVATADSLTEDTTEECGHGIHMAHIAWAVDYGKTWKDLAILEVEADTSGIIVPVNGSGKVRAASVKVLREVPLEECGLLGKILAKKK